MKTKTILLVFLCFGIIVNFIGCSKKNNSEKKQEIIPLKIGNFWTYSNKYYFSGDKRTIYDAVGITYKIGEKVSLNNKNCYLFGFFGYTNIGFNDKDGFWAKCSDNLSEEISLNNITLDSLALLFQYPTKVGNIWFSWYDNYFRDTITTKDLNVNIKVPAGSFNCIHYQFKNLENYPKSGFYLCPGVGLIKCEFIMNVGLKRNIPDTTWNILELIKYKVK